MATDLQTIADSLLRGTCNFFLGAGASGPSPHAHWQTSGRYPNADQLKTFLLQAFNEGPFREPSIPEVQINLELEETLFGSARTTLAEVAGHVALAEGRAELHRRLRAVFVGKQVFGTEATPSPAPIHALIANSICRARSATRDLTYPLILTTNYDDLMERALDEAKLPFRVFSLATGDSGQPLMKESRRTNVVGLPRLQPTAHRQHRSHPRELRDAVFVLKLHGEIPSELYDGTDYVISELDYMRYLLRVDPQRLFPIPMMEAYLKQANALILGYGFRDWNMRMFFSKVWEHSDNKRWAVGLGFGAYQSKLLESHFRIAPIASDLDEFSREVTRLIG